MQINIYKQISMFFQYFKIAFRNMRKFKAQSLISIFGLAFGLACFVPALYWMCYEISFDNFHPDSKQIYRIYAIEKQSGKVNELVPGILEKNLRKQFPSIESATIFFSEINNCKTEKIPHIRLRTINTDSTFFSVFTQEFVSGDPYQPLHTMFNIVLTESVAIGLFGDVEKAIGQKIQSTFYFFNPPYTVTAVVKDPPINTNLPFDALLFHDLLAGIASSSEEMQWSQFSMQLYIKLYDHADIEYFSEELCDFTSRINVNPAIELRIMHVSDVRHWLNSDTPFTFNTITLFVAAGLLLIFSVIFNFLNLYLELFRLRGREFRLRSVHGANRGQLILQMLFELGCVILISLLFAGAFVIFAHPVFSRLMSIEIDVTELIELFAICGIGVMVLMLFVGFLQFSRLSLLAARDLLIRKTTGQMMLRHMGVTMQLIVSIIFIVAALVVMEQIRFSNQKDLGFSDNGIIQLYGLPPYMETSVRTALIDKLLTIPQVKSISTSNFTPQYNTNSTEVISQVDWSGKLSNEKPTFNVLFTDHQFAEILGLKMLMGEWLSEGGEQQVILNEEAVRLMGLREPVGSIIRISIHDIDMDIAMKEYNVNYQVAGVVRDFHTLSLRNRIHPTIFIQSLPVNSRIVADNILYIHVLPGQEEEAVKRIATLLPDIDPSFFDLRVMTLGEVYDSFNHSEQTGFKIFSVLATACLMISLFGIYAVATASTQRRRKEIAVRKIVGANVDNIVDMFFREYTLQVIMAGVIALPIVYLLMSRWLQGYAYHTDITWELLVGVLAGVIVVVLLTVLGQVLKVANSNPSEVVKSE